MMSPKAPTSSAAASQSRRFDQPLATALVAILVVYSVLVTVAYHRLAQAEEHAAAAAVMDETTTTTITTTTATADHVARQVAAESSPSRRFASVEEFRTQSFPWRVGAADSEDIPHPGLALVEDLRNRHPKAHGADSSVDELPKTLRVPQFFAKALGYLYEPNNHAAPNVRNVLGDHGRRLLTPDEAASIGSVVVTNDKELQTIYVSVASYRDYECRNTVTDLLERAEFPQRIRVAILEQRLPHGESQPPCYRPLEHDCDGDEASSHVLCRWRRQIDYFFLDARLAVGPVFARHIAHRHYRGETFAMQVDSHVRFTHHWDTDMIDQWTSAKNEMAVLTTYLSDLNGRIDPVTHFSTNPARPIMCVSGYEGQGAYKHLRHGQQPEGPAGIHGQPTLQPFWAAGFSFARGHFVVQVPYDQYLPMVFQGEEISIGLRGFTHGYDYYAPERGVCFHMYAAGPNKKIREKVPLFWEHSRMYQGVGMLAMKRLNALIGMQKPDQDNVWPHDEMEDYSLGQVREAKTFFTTFGIHTEKQTTEKHLCRFVGKPMMKEFLPALRDNRMGLDYSKIQYQFVDQWPNDK